MESATVERTATEAATGAKTLADLFPAAVRKHGAKRAVVYKDDAGVWVSKTYAEVGEIVRKLSLGLMDLGIEKGDKVAILANTRPEWTYFDFAALSRRRDRRPDLPDELAGGVPVRARELRRRRRWSSRTTSSSRRSARSAISCPKLEHVIRMTGKSERRDLARRARRARRLGHATPSGSSASSSVGPDDICTFIYTSGTTGPAEGLRDLARQLPRDARHGPRGQRARRRRGHLPLPAARALVRAADPARQLRPRRRRSPTGSATR